jgi:hypothetical protein
MGPTKRLDDPARLRLYARLGLEGVRVEHVDDLDRRRLLMLGLRLFDETPPALPALIAPLVANAPLREELVQLCHILDDRIQVASQVASVPPEWPLAVHRTYARDEVFAAVGASTVEKRVHSREGLHRMADRKAQLFFVTIDKSSEGRFSPTTSYEDYAISPTLFHWQSQSTTSEQSPTGQAYINGHGEGWRFYLFARPTVDDQFTFLGPVRFRSHQGSRPITIVWELEVPIPPAFLGVRALRAARGRDSEARVGSFRRAERRADVCGDVRADREVPPRSTSGSDEAIQGGLPHDLAARLLH